VVDARTVMKPPIDVFVVIPSIGLANASNDLYGDRDMFREASVLVEY